MAGFGAVGYATRRDLSVLARFFFWALVALIVFGIVLVFVQIPNGALIYAVAGLVIFAGLTAFDFQRLRRTEDIRAASRRVDLPRRPQRVSVVPLDLCSRTVTSSSPAFTSIPASRAYWSVGQPQCPPDTPASTGAAAMSVRRRH